jgi:transcriptional regulator GlxA family with amidase domain
MVFLQFIADYIANIDTPWLNASASRNQETLRRIMNHVESHLAEDLSLNAIARGAGVSNRTLSRLFKRETGMTVLDFAHHRRIARACHYLGTTELTCIEIAFAVGYRSVQNFNRIFRRRRDTTPREWRLGLAKAAILTALNPSSPKR